MHHEAFCVSVLVLSILGSLTEPASCSSVAAHIAISYRQLDLCVFLRHIHIFFLAFIVLLFRCAYGVSRAGLGLSFF